MSARDRMRAALNAELPEGMRDSPLVEEAAERMGAELERLEAASRMPYPPVFRDWSVERRDARRVATFVGPAGPGIEFMHEALPHRAWARVELVEEDACLLAASLLQRAERDDLADLVLRGLGSGA